MNVRNPKILNPSGCFLHVENYLKSYPHRHFFCVSVIHICLSYVEISSFTHSDSLFIFCCVYLHNIFLNILIIFIYNPLFCLLHTILYDF